MIRNRLLGLSIADGWGGWQHGVALDRRRLSRNQRRGIDPGRAADGQLDQRLRSPYPRCASKSSTARSALDAGIAQITARSVDFGASDAPLTPEQAAACNGCVQIPWALSGVGIGYNIPGVKPGKLKLTGKVVAAIYLGQITKWNDPKIKKLNPGVHLPGLTITPVFRSDGSGTTYAFAHYESKVSPAFKNNIGYATTVSFPVGVGAKGNAGVTATVQATKGSIGYIEASYLVAAGLGAAAIQNKAGNLRLPEPEEHRRSRIGGQTRSPEQHSGDRRPGEKDTQRRTRSRRSPTASCPTARQRRVNSNSSSSTPSRPGRNTARRSISARCRKSW